MIEKVKCKFCPLSEISLRKGSYTTDDKKTRGFKRYCRFFDKHVNPHIERDCETGHWAIKEHGPRKLYPFNIKAET
jgi:hypothetical protein